MTVKPRLARLNAFEAWRFSKIIVVQPPRVVADRAERS